MQKDIQKLYQKLPDPYAIKPEQVRASYQFLYDRVNDSFQKKDYVRVYNLLYSSINSGQLNFELPNKGKDNLLYDIINLIYTILTIYPVKYFKAQLAAATFLNKFFKTHRHIPGLVLNWHPFYKVMKYFTFSDESFFIFGENVPHYRNDDIKLYINNFFKLSSKISQYFPDKPNSEEDTTKQLVKKFIPKISPSSKYSQPNIQYFCYLCPPHKGRYKLFIDFLLLELRDISNDTNSISIFYLINKIIKSNIEDDFSFLIPVVSQFISMNVANKIKVKYPNALVNSIFFRNKFEQIDFSFIMAKIVTSLFISPHTRKSILDNLENFFISFKSSIHPSVPKGESSSIDEFILYIILSLKKGLKEMTKSDTKNKNYFDMKRELGPSQEDLHKLLSLTSEQEIMNIRYCEHPISVLIENSLDPSTIDHYFEIAYQCINMMDTEENLSANGWIIFSSLVISIDKNEKIQKNIEQIIEIAANNLYRIEIQHPISLFLRTLFSKMPFNKKNSLKGLNHLNYPRLASLIITNLLSVFRSLPKHNDDNDKSMDDDDDDINEVPPISNKTTKLINSFVFYLISNSDDEVKEELVPIFVSLATDEDVAPNYNYLISMFSNFSFFATSKQAETISKAFEEQIELRRHNSTMFCYLSYIYSSILPSNLKTTESVRHVIDVLLPFTKDKDSKIRSAAWRSISSALKATDCLTNLNIQLKPEKMKENPFENAKLEDFDITWEPKIEMTDLAFEVYDQVYEKLLTLKDPHEINELLKDVKISLCYYFVTCNTYTDGSIDNEVDEFYKDPIYNVPYFYRERFPMKDKFIKCALRIFNDFPDQENLIYNVNDICSNFFIVLFQKESESYEAIQLQYYYLSYDYTSPYYNKSVVYELMFKAFTKRRNQFLIRINDDMKKLITANIELSLSKYERITDLSNVIMFTLCPYYKPLLISIFENIVNKINGNQFDVFVKFLGMSSFSTVVEQNQKLCNKIFTIILNSDLKNKEDLKDLMRFFMWFCISSQSFGSPMSNQKEFIDLLNEIEKNYLKKNLNNRTYNYFLILIIYMCLKRVYDVSDNIFKFIMKNIIQFDEKISEIAGVCLDHLLKRRQKITKERINVTKFPTISMMPDVLDQVSVKLQDDGIYFLTSNMTEINKTEKVNHFKSEEEDDEKEKQYSPDENSKIKEKEDIKKIFESFEKVEFEWKNDEIDQIFENEFFNDRSNGFFQFKDHYIHKKYEFVNDEFLIKSIRYLIATASNSINEKNLKISVSYHNIWKNYALIIGPYCTKEINKICIEYVSEYYSKNSMIVSKVLNELVNAFMTGIFYWNKKDRTDFIKLVVLPLFSIFLSNPNTSDIVCGTICKAIFLYNPIYIAPLIKVLFCLSSAKPNLPIYNRSLISLLSNQIVSKPFHFFNCIEKIVEKFVNEFIENMGEYNSFDTKNMMKLIFALFSACSFLHKNSPLYSNEIESKLSTLLKIYEGFLNKIIENEPIMKRNFIHALSTSLSLYSASSYDVCISVFPLFLRHLHKILSLLNSTNIKVEETFIKSVGFLIESRIFITNNEIELKFVSSLVKETMNLSLPMQLILLENLNKMIEVNILNIPKKEYDDYIKILLNYASFVKTKNLGNELRLKIAKILGIFEIKKSDITFGDVNRNSVDDDVMKAASIILNSFLFDRGDERVKKAFSFMEENCTSKKSRNIEFFKSVSEIFTRRHVDHVLNDVEDLIIQCMGMLAPSYIC